MCPQRNLAPLDLPAEVAVARPCEFDAVLGTAREAGVLRRQLLIGVVMCGLFLKGFQGLLTVPRRPAHRIEVDCAAVLFSIGLVDFLIGAAPLHQIL